MNLSDLRIDIAAENEGRWVSGIPEMGDLELLVRGLDCDAAQRVRARVARMRESGLRHQHMPDVMVRELMARPNPAALSRVLIEAVLLDWRGLTDGGEPVLYSRDTAERLILEPRFRLFRNAVIWAADRVGKSSAWLAKQDREAA